MPIYLCKPGVNSVEPWRHGIPVYPHPFPLNTNSSANGSTGDGLDRARDPEASAVVRSTAGSTGPGSSTVTVTVTAHEGNVNSTSSLAMNLVEHDQLEHDQLEHEQQQKEDEDWEETRNQPITETSGSTLVNIGHGGPERTAPSTRHSASTSTPLSSQSVGAIRRIRHSEVVLVDDVVYMYSNYWLRVCWPGSKGGFAGYVCLVAHTNHIKQTLDAGAGDGDGANSIQSKLEEKNPETSDDPSVLDNPANPADEMPLSATESFTEFQPVAFLSNHETLVEGSRAPSPGFYAVNSDENTLRCLRTGVIFPSSTVLNLLSNYDDGLVPPVTIPFEGQHVFCRICRDGLHDDDENGETDAGDNPLLAPCECSGSMAFVHYLCVEQWRCRSRHPEARNGTHCETCSKPYALPPPSSRPVSQVEEEWLEAMPPHVMAALRQPHFGWQLGAALVRRRWFRPMAPVIVSPIVALYCRARRLLKKRGVSRRRWACSLCRRRARWKCVRCLRSYYCSRQCQNVSWHIVHKHVCYKPSRFWWSVVVYGALLLVLIPGILRDPLLYDLAFSFLPPSFYIMAVLGGGLAAVLKRIAGVDVRGRVLELMVVVMTAWLVYVSWGIVWGMFGEPEACVGVVGASYESSGFVRGVEQFVLLPARTYFMLLDKSAMRYDRVRSLLCTSKDGGCFPHLSKASPELLLESDACVGDIRLVSGLWLAAGATLAVSAVVKKRRRGQARPHQD